MKQKLCVFALLLSVFLSGCGGAPAAEEQMVLAATTYPVYLMAQAVTEGAEQVEVNLVVDQELSCLHDYTLTVQDMQVIEAADLVLMNGAGLEDFLSDALEGKTAVDCSNGVTLLRLETENCDDPHIWMDPNNAAVMAQNIADALEKADPEQAELYQANAEAAGRALGAFAENLKDQLAGLSCRKLITFHDGFSYFAQALDLEILAAVEEEEGGEAPAQTIAEIVSLVEQYRLPAIFTETNGSTATAETIARECGIQTAALNMCMSGNGGGLAAYESILQDNADTLLEVLA